MSNKETQTQEKDKGATALVPSQKFTNMLEREMMALAGKKLDLTPYQQKLAKHLFIRCDSVLRKQELDRKRANKNVTPFTWENVKLKELVEEAVPIIQLGLDALLPAHVYPIPYLEGGQYRLNLQIGFEGLIWTRTRYAVNTPKEIRLELVYENDVFKPIKKDKDSPIETYEFRIVNPLSDRGKLIGGFGYIVFEEPSQNVLVLVTDAQIKKIRGKAQTTKIWDEWNEEMVLKTIAKKTCKLLKLDPEKINSRALYDLEQREYDEVESVESNFIEEQPTEPMVIEEPEKELNEDKSETPETPTKPKQTRKKPQGKEEDSDNKGQTELPLEADF